MMYTETELRDALQFSAARADALLTETVPDRQLGELFQLSDAARRPSPSRTWLAATATAAVVAAVGAGVLLTSGTGASKHAPAASHRPVTNGGPATHAHAAVALNNLITVRETDGSGYQFGPAGAAQVRTVGGTPAVNIIALPPSTPFDPATQIADAQPVPVAGTTGYYGKVSAALGSTAADASKYAGPKATLAWRAGNGTWIFIQGEYHDVNLSLSTLLTRYQQLGITAAPAPLPPLPYRAGWLPDGLTVSSLDWTPDLTDVRLTSGTNWIEINQFEGTVTSASTVHGPGLPPAEPHATRNTGHTHLAVTVHGYPRATAQKILDHLDLSRVHNPQSSWWTVTEAFNS